MKGSSSRISIATPVAFNDPLPDEVDVAIIGGGVIGVFSALYLARMGKRVLVCEKGRIAGEQSSRNWGWIRQHGRDAAELPIMMQALRLWREADAQTAGQCGVVTAGTYYLASSPGELARLESWLPIAREHGLDTKVLSKSEVSDMYSGQAAYPWAGGTCTASDARGEPWAAVPAVARLAQAAGALVREDCAVRALDMAAGRLRGVVTEHGHVACEQAVLAGGAWSSLLARRHGIDIPQLSVRATVARTAPMADFFADKAADERLALRRRADGGYSLALADRHGFYLGPDAFRHFQAYLPLLRHSWKEVRPGVRAPAGFPDGWGTPRHWAEDSESPFEGARVLEPSPDMAHVRLMAGRFAERFPGLGQPEIIDSWAGMIDSMPDVVPIVDRIPAIEGLIVATGMSGHGFGIGPGFGLVIARMAAGEAAEHDLQRFRFARFSDGSPLDMGPAL